MKRRINFLILALLFLAAPLLAETVTVGGETVMRLPAEKAQNAQMRIDQKLEAAADPDGILAKKTANGYGVFWGDTLIVEVDKALAIENKSTPEGLAVVWAKRLFELVGPGMLQVSPRNLVMPLGEESVLQLGGLADGPVYLEGGDGVVTPRADGESVIVRAEAVGSTYLVISRGKAKVKVPIRVKDWAGYPPGEVTIQVTGDPAPGDMVAEASLRAVAGSTRLNPGAYIKFPEEMPAIPSVPQGDKMRYAQPIEIVAGDDYFPVKTRVEVQVESVDLELKEPNLLLVSNRPERVEDDGVLLEYTLTEDEPSRLMYSHLNQTLADRNLWVNLYNETNEPVKVWIGSTYAGPNRNEVHTGHMAAVRFLRQLGAEAGFVVEIPPRQRFVVAHHLMNRRDLLSGFVNLQIVGQGSLRAEVHSKLTPSSNNTVGAVRLGGPFNPFKIHPHGVFAQPYFEEWIDMTQDSPSTEVPFGKSPWLIDFETGLPNTGNFGVLYRYHFVLQNTSRSPVDFEMIFRPHSGPGAGTFLVDGDILEAPFRKQGVETSLGRFRVEPGAERTVDLVTLPEASSCYPAYVTMRPVR
ncbi:MAG: hypothetical protein KC800_06390 [Candidatus Eremiobacteraeota bacterium]|nr:hypothetical protein [Candidatus Eremiobacteraeota bacterium]